jgi:DNA repair protein RecN (Recombination protein N)
VIEELRIRSLGVIRDAVLPLGPGLSVITGETGAGKTMVVSGLALLLGGRADAAAVRSGDDAAVVEGRLVLDPSGPAAERAREAGAELDDDVLLACRTVAGTGRSRAHVGGRAVPVGVLAEVGASQVAVHGQSEQVGLRSATRQREVLDRFAGDAVSGTLERYRADHARLRAVRAQLDDGTARAAERVREAELLRLGLAEVERVRPVPGEDRALREQVERLSHAGELRAAAEAAHAALTGDPAAGVDGADAAALVGVARKALDDVRGHDPQLAALGDRVSEICYLVADVAADLAGYAAAAEVDPATLEASQQRLAALGALTRTHGPDVEAVLAWEADAAARLGDLDGADDRLHELAAERDALLTALTEAAARLGVARRAAAERLAAGVDRELAALAMPGARLEVRVSGRPGAAGGPDVVRVDLGDGPAEHALGPAGADEVELRLVPHPGAAPRPLARGASGGELSRVMLALEVVLAGADPVPTFVFDEVDAGVGGRAAVEVGRRLARLGRTAQVLVVTHLPQVAAFADRHLVVEKAADGGVTETGVRLLDDAGRVGELARMLAGAEDSGAAREHAAELLDAAAGERATWAGSSPGAAGIPPEAPVRAASPPRARGVCSATPGAERGTIGG